MEHQGGQSCDHTGHGLLRAREQDLNKSIVSGSSHLLQDPPDIRSGNGPIDFCVSDAHGSLLRGNPLAVVSL